MAHGIESHACRVTAHLLTHHRHAYAVAPDLELVDSGSAESVGCSKDDLVACLLELMSEFADGRSLADAIDAYDKHDIRTLHALTQAEAIEFLTLVLGQECRYLLT